MSQCTKDDQQDLDHRPPGDRSPVRFYEISDDEDSGDEGASGIIADNSRKVHLSLDPKYPFHPSVLNAPLADLLPPGVNLTSLTTGATSQQLSEEDTEFDLPVEVQGDIFKPVFQQKIVVPNLIPGFYPCYSTDEAVKVQVDAYIKYMKHILTLNDHLSTALLQGKVFVSRMRCPLTVNLWKLIDQCIPTMTQYHMDETVRDLVRLILDSPDQAVSYMRGVSRCVPHCKSVTPQISVLEERVSDLTKRVTELLDDITIKKDDFGKFDDQISNVSQNVSKFQSIMDQLMIQDSKRDLLPDRPVHDFPSASIPSSSTVSKGVKVEYLDFDLDGEYSGIYSIKIQGGEIVSLEFPPSYPELAIFVDFPLEFRQFFFNRSQSQLLCKLGKSPEIRKYLTPEMTDERRKAVLTLTEDLSEEKYQWELRLPHY